MPFPKIETPAEGEGDARKVNLSVNGRVPRTLVSPVKPERTDPDFQAKVRAAIERAGSGR